MVTATQSSKKPKTSKQTKNTQECCKKHLQEIEELTNTLKRVQAEFENYQKRMQREQEEYAKHSSITIIKKFLPVLDNLELAISHIKEHNEFTKGVEMIYASMIEMLTNEGLHSIEAVGLPYDPYRHEALMKKESDKEANTVLEIMQKGYVLHDKVVRPAKVIVSSGGMKHE